jgi:hypothetical protein
VHENLNGNHILLLRIFLAQAACADWSEKIGKMYLVPVCSAGAGHLLWTSIPMLLSVTTQEIKSVSSYIMENSETDRQARDGQVGLSRT